MTESAITAAASAAAAKKAIDLNATHTVVCLEMGYDNVKVREPGEEFEMRKFNEDGSLHKAPWFKPVNPDEDEDLL